MLGGDDADNEGKMGAGFCCVRQENVKGCIHWGVRESAGSHELQSAGICILESGPETGWEARRCVILVRPPAGVDGSERVDWRRRKGAILAWSERATASAGDMYQDVHLLSSRSPCILSQGVSLSREFSPRRGFAWVLDRPNLCRQRHS